MKFELFEFLRYLEIHAENSNDFARKLNSMTQEEAFKLMSSMTKEEEPSLRKFFEK